MSQAEGDLFHPTLATRYDASLKASPEQRQKAISEVMRAAQLPRRGTSGAANAFVVIIGSEFGTESTPDRPHYHPATMGHQGWDTLWQLRIGEPNPHFDQDWDRLRRNTTLWRNLHSWLPVAFGNTHQAHSMFAWANLSVTSGGVDKGTADSHWIGMNESVSRLIDATLARVVVSTNEATRVAMDRWFGRARADLVGNVTDVAVWRLKRDSRPAVLGAKLGHPSRLGPGNSKTAFCRRLHDLILAANNDI